jgi:hypothetical protein
MSSESLLRSMFELDNSVWGTVGATGVAYALALCGLFLALFVGPYLLFRLA